MVDREVTSLPSAMSDHALSYGHPRLDISTEPPQSQEIMARIGIFAIAGHLTRYFGGKRYICDSVCSFLVVPLNIDWVSTMCGAGQSLAASVP